MRILLRVIAKEFLQLRRDRRMVGILFIAPIIQLIVFGFAANLDVTDVRLFLVDADRTAQSRDLAQRFVQSGYFELVGSGDRADDAEPWLIRGSTDVALVIPRGFGEARQAGRPAPVQLLADGADATAANVGLSYAGRIALAAGAPPLDPRGAAIAIEPRVWYNPEMKSRWFYLPAILAMVLMMVTMISPSMAVVREKEIGTLEQLIVTPIRSWQLIVGKLAPFAVIGLLDLLIVTAITVFFFGVPLRGSLGVLVLLSLPMLVTLLGLGLFVSTVVNNQQQAMLSSMFLLMIPFIYLSGLMFPIENMPRFIQGITYAIPLRYYVPVIRGVFLKGSGLDVLWPEGLILCGFAVGIVTLASLRFRKRLD
ncbi:MAG: ABC transporter permease [Acidobacteria bacterium]|nr:ABC transporter permease [Acidobacteriota bacterium]